MDQPIIITNEEIDADIANAQRIQKMKKFAKNLVIGTALTVAAAGVIALVVKKNTDITEILPE